MLRQLQPQANNVRVWSDPETFFEGTAEVTDAQRNLSCQLIDSDGVL
jgi:hypothetical protein